jgi:hypothetical protein
MGVKRSLLVEADGGPLSVVVAGANVPDFKLLEETMEARLWWSALWLPSKLLNICAWTRVTTSNRLGRRSSATAIHLISGASVRRRRTLPERSAIRRGDGWSNVRWAGFLSAEPSSYVRRRRPPKLPGVDQDRLHPAMVPSSASSIPFEIVSKTVGNYVSNIFTKLQVSDRAQAIIRARDAGLG